ncbi:pentapeptide repeat-containing protein [Geminocystis sp. CENA526]|uniref:pentapeptide repeat-containing protein n=1 Tax=Geminocystis sp. CENA526 TaxID=1355871 RepID=UPI003D6EF954
MQLLESHNQCPDCVLMELNVIPEENTNNKFGVYLNLKFGQQQEKILEGKVNFSLRSSQLILGLNNIKLVEKCQINTDLVSIVDSVFSAQPTWKINPIKEQKLLQENLSNLKLAVIEIEDSSSELTAQIVAKKASIFLSDIEGLWLHDITPNKHAILERKLAEFIENNYFKPYISQAIFQSQDNVNPSNLSHENKDEVLTIESNILKKMIQFIYRSQKDNFMELAEIAGLNPLTDFAGGDLTGVNLSGLNLSSSNFSYSNLRGADLTDTDFSEANLKYTKLSGADLSGAYLEGTNLENANLQSASLALANVIGANLSYANLTNTNLQNTSLGKTNVKEAIFASNLGLDDEKKQELIKEGAIFN